MVYKNYIDGEWVASSSGEVFENRNPAHTDEVIGLFQKSTKEDVDRAVQAAVEAYNGWRLTPAPKRAELLYDLGRLLMERKEDFARDMTREMGKVLKETRGDVQEAIDMTFFIAGEGRRLYGHTTPSELPNKFAMSVRMPVGPTAIITPWNFPMAIPAWKLIPALLCGNTVVCKPATDTPLSFYHLVKACEEVGIPPGVVNLVTGPGGVVGEALLSHPDIRLVSFTGSSEVGSRIGDVCAQSHKKCSLEMGGKNPIIVMDDADLDLAVDGTIWGAFGTTGQRCTAASRVIVQKGVLKEFTDKLVARAKALKVGDGLDPTVEMGPVINESQMEKILDYIEIGKEEGARLLCGGHRLEGGEYDEGYFIAPTVFADVDPGMRIAQEEIFGPVTDIIPVDSLEEAIEVANGTVYGLSSSIYTNDVDTAFVAMRDLYFGLVYVNAPTIGSEVHLPFGGTRQTGNGHREGGGHTVLDIFSEWKTIYVDYSGRLQRAQIDTHQA
ncbi:MAG: aldehyde dehydrogenase family protein [Anaerolineae bacterium]